MTGQKPKPHAVQAKHLDSLLLESKLASDRIINYFLISYFIAGLLLAFFYDTWSVAIGVGGLSLLAYYASRLILPQSNVYQYVLSAVLGVFMAQYIYQMHGMFEMHFVAFISSAVLITYQNWKLQIPITLVVVLHHAVFGYLQFLGFDKVYFTKLEYMDLQTFIIHVLLAGVIFFICGLWAYHFRKYKIANINQIYELGLLQEKEAHAEEKRIAQEKIIQSEANLKTFFSNTHTAFLLLDRKYNIVAFNENAEKLVNTVLDLPMEAGRNYFEYIPDGRRETVKEAMDTVVGGNLTQYETTHKNSKTGTDIWVDVSMHPVLDNNRNLIGISVALSDITERKTLEEQVALERIMKQNAITEAVLAAQENERTEIGKELHDNVNQILAAACLYIDTARKREEDRDSLLETSAAFTQSAIEEIRKLAKTLITPLIRDAGLEESVRGLIDDIMDVHQIEIEFITESFSEDLLNEKFKLNIFRIMQEQINNTLRHAKASLIKINFSQHGDQLFISITDNGVGFDTSKRKKGVGISNIISRAELYKGDITINSAPGKGCSMEISFSMRELLKHKALNKSISGVEEKWMLQKAS